ncbi:MAG TPA: hypothetical protein VFR68_12510 [Candidatus Dormibacteraeota bacterium]|nr:hypothetical protein [Candidatus Dormibacteraeota bacterium]
MITRCVGFVEDQITGLQLIQRSGVEYQAQTFGSMGSAICQLDNEPSSVPSDCFGSGPYWQYSRRQAAGWQPSAIGASGSAVHDGDMDGWRYAAGSGQTPPNIAFVAVCSAPPPNAGAPTSHSLTTPVAPRAPATAPPASSAPTPTATASPSLDAVTPSASPSRHLALAATGPTTRPPASSPLGTWLLLAGATALLLGLGVVNFLRRGP